MSCILLYIRCFQMVVEMDQLGFGQQYILFRPLLRRLTTISFKPIEHPAEWCSPSLRLMYTFLFKKEYEIDDNPSYIVDAMYFESNSHPSNYIALIKNNIVNVASRNKNTA